MKKKIVSFLAILCLSLTVLAACGKGSTAEKEKLTVYTAIEEELVQSYLESYKKENPNVEVTIVRDSTGIITAKLLAEGKNTKADVIWGVSASSLLTLEQKDLLAGYTPKGSDAVLPNYKDTKSPTKWVGVAGYQTGIIVNTTELKKKNIAIPQTYADLTKPEYKGLIAMPNPASSGTGFLTVSAWLQMMGDTKAWEFMTELHKNIGTYTQSGSKPAKLAAAGEYPIGITLAYSGVQQLKQGAPVEIVLPKEGLGWDVEANALVNKEGNSDNKVAQKFLDWALTKDVMQKAFDANGFVSIKNEFKAPENFPKNIEEKMYKENNLQWAATNREPILKMWDQKFAEKAEVTKK
ncbi:putative 2-aminoethylphosphonate ABC transporter substrate-binding protein [Carnobacterium gallinarum]|uniref:putative 2-aminoethylphosphonate ABC transporter substrate-binding protein n=1 Tax=Carnobacterium gallinarum TaxID=2749 RepID=UPI0005519A2E|nr:putative 2-aminoethylphosphonate ABC transporter substrate-binding protein [Carnobacterium gallinarum]